MAKHHRFWKARLALTCALMVLAACQPATPLKDLPTPPLNRAPNISQNLAPTSGFQGQQGAPTQLESSRALNDPSGGAVKTIPVGLLVPLTGRNAALGRALQDAATISLFDKYARLGPIQQNTRVVLITKDTGDTGQQAAAAMKAAVEAGAQFIIGPVFADAAEAVAPIAKEKNLSILSFSNSRTRASPDTYMFGFSPEEQAARVVSFAVSNGRSKIAVLAPRSPLGDAVLKAARETAVLAGGAVVAEASYAAQGVGIDAAVSSIAQPGVPPKFDAILIPEGGAALDTIIRTLGARGVTPANVQFLGTGIWDDETLLRRVNLERAWFVSSPPESSQQFKTRFISTYNYEPPRIASLAYDAVALAVTLATSGRPFDASALTSAGGFMGPANGTFRLRGSGAAERLLAVIQVEAGGGLRGVSPPPAGFTAP